MNRFAAFAEDDEDDYQQTPTSVKPPKKSTRSVTQPIKSARQ